MPRNRTSVAQAKYTSGNTPRPSAAAGVGLVAHTLRRWRAARQLSKSRELQLNKDKRITAAHDVTKPAHTADVTTSNIPVTTLPPRLHQRRNHTNNLSSPTTTTPSNIPVTTLPPRLHQRRNHTNNLSSPTTTTLANIRPHDRTMPAGSSSMGEIFQRHQPDVAGSVGFTPNRVPTH